jgi:hypothetical protein
MLDRFRKKLKEDRKTIKDFIQEYLPDRTYSAVSLQLGGFNKVQEYLEVAIEKYLKGE